MSPTESAERYVAGRMSEEEEQLFETAMLERPELAAEVDARQRMKAGLQTLEARGELDGLLTRSRPSQYVQYAAAACVVLVLIAGVALWRSSHETPPVMAGSLEALSLGSAERTVAESYLLVSTRSRQEEPVIRTERTRAIQLQVMPDLGDAPTVAATLTKVSDSTEVTIAAGIRVRSAGVGLFNIFLNPTALGSGHYRLTLTREADSAPAVSYSFELQVPGGPPRSGRD